MGTPKVVVLFFPGRMQNFPTEPFPPTDVRRWRARLPSPYRLAHAAAVLEQRNDGESSPEASMEISTLNAKMKQLNHR